MDAEKEVDEAAGREIANPVLVIKVAMPGATPDDPEAERPKLNVALFTPDGKPAKRNHPVEGWMIVVVNRTLEVLLGYRTMLERKAIAELVERDRKKRDLSAN